MTSPEPPAPTAAEVESVEAEIAAPGAPVPAGVGSDV